MSPQRHSNLYRDTSDSLNLIRHEPGTNVHQAATNGSAGNRHELCTSTPVRTNLGKRDCPFWPPSMLRPGTVPPPDNCFSLGSNPNPALPPASIEGAKTNNPVFQS